MEHLGSRKRKSDQISVSEDQYTVDIGSQKIPTKAGDAERNESPLKRQKVGITLAQKQALIDNLQLEITERARKLRANYNIHAQSLRTRIEIRVNRIPLSLRKLTMGELLERYSTEQQQNPNAHTSSTRGPPVPAKDPAPSRPPIRAPATIASSSSRQTKRTSHEISGGDKENETQTPQKKVRADPVTDVARNPAQVLSPTTSNSRIAPRSVATPGRSGIARPVVTPGRAVVATNILNRMVEGARSTTRPTTTTARKTMTSAAPSSSANIATTATGTTADRRKRGATVTAAAKPLSRPATRMARRASGISESSEGSTSTVVRKRPMTAPPGAQPKPPAPQPTAAKRTMLSTVKKAVTSGTTRKPPATKAAAPSASTAGTGRVLRKRA
ncbi:Borealin N terminal-domain-containing protein [Chaetomium strumarium]|uniref:Borealin N terminal-domain-containing protein n=1 Tax=Chaetomium strumarium TaxID=1170767 RepID=A0AAJ0M6S4_9PEZI|nr:Borealin N terminal-domain-containing protein [Chaetomium strumarium]